MEICTQNVSGQDRRANIFGIKLFQTLKNWKANILKGTEKQTVLVYKTEPAQPLKITFTDKVTG